MELGKRIVHYRKQMNISQEELAEKVYVTRQSISNWENDKTYPDVHSLLLLSTIFQVSLDDLIKGDIEMIKKIVSEKDLRQFEQDGKLLTLGFLIVPLTVFPLFHFLDWWGIGIFGLEFLLLLRVALKVEAFKKQYDVKTYRQLVAISNGQTLDTIQEAEKKAKYPYQMPLVVLGVGILTAVLVWLSYIVISLFI